MNVLDTRPGLVRFEERRSDCDIGWIVGANAVVEDADLSNILRFVEDCEVLCVASHADVRLDPGVTGYVVQKVV